MCIGRGWSDCADDFSLSAATVSFSSLNPQSNKKKEIAWKMASRAQIIAAYKAILHRPPENDRVIEEHYPYSLDDLLTLLVNSAEFRKNFSKSVRSDNHLAIDDLDDAADAFLRGDKDTWAGRTLELPSWYNLELPPESQEFRDQVLKFWSLITAREDYNPHIHEDTAEISDFDPVKSPGFYSTYDTKFAGAQIIAMGHIILRSGLVPGNRVLEYGAGYAQTALALARMGISVDTVDINPAFCRAVQANADLFSARLTPHCAPFGHNPAGELNSYDVILFYESFHHCLDFINLIPKIKSYLKPDGRVLLAGEPIFDGASEDMPYPWGIRLDWENVAIMRIRGWMELGFQKDFLLRKFAESGFDCNIHNDPNSHWAQVYEFRQK